LWVLASPSYTTSVNLPADDAHQERFWLFFHATDILSFMFQSK
jgi:hypothetical protein